MGAVNTTYTFTPTDTITSTKMNNIIDETVMTSQACLAGGGLEVASGQLTISSNAINSSRLAASSVTTNAILNENVTEEKLAVGARIPSGAIMAFAMNSAPTGWVAANGASVSTTTYAALFAAIGYTYGGSGGSFNLPDLRGYFVRGSGTNSDSTASGTFGAKQNASLLNHTHSGTTGTVSANHQHGYTRYNNLINNVTLVGGANNVWQGTTTALSDFFTADHTHNFTTGNPSAGGGSETRPVNIAMLYCIKL